MEQPSYRNGSTLFPVRRENENQSNDTNQSDRSLGRKKYLSSAIYIYIYIYIRTIAAYITYKVRTESPARNMTDSITHVSGREKPPTDVIPLCVGDLCPRSSLRVSEAACTRIHTYAHTHSVRLWMHTRTRARIYEDTRRGGARRRRESRTCPHRYGVANGEIQPATETVILSLSLSLSLCLSVSFSFSLSLSTTFGVFASRSPRQ